MKRQAYITHLYEISWSLRDSMSTFALSEMPKRRKIGRMILMKLKAYQVRLILAYSTKSVICLLMSVTSGF
jgi:hypothetical protein